MKHNPRNRVPRDSEKTKGREESQRRKSAVAQHRNLGPILAQEHMNIAESNSKPQKSYGASGAYSNQFIMTDTDSEQNAAVRTQGKERLGRQNDQGEMQQTI